MRAWEMIKNILMPPRCASCGILLSLREDGSDECLCDRCSEMWRRAREESCPVCLLPSRICLCAPHGGPAEAYSIPKVLTYTPSRRNIQSRMIYSLKTVNDRRISRFLARELAVSAGRYLEEAGIQPNECIYTYVPRRRRAEARYGFDQARRLAKELSAICGGEFMHLFVRHGGKEQKKLDKSQRKENIKTAIGLSRRVGSGTHGDVRGKAGEKGRGAVKGRCVVIVDDLITTGATLGYAARLLRRAGAESVILTCVAMTAQSTARYRRSDVGGAHG